MGDSGLTFNNRRMAMNVIATDISAHVRTRYNFTVDKFPLRGPDGMRTNYYGLFRSDTSESVGGGSVSSRYCPHTTDDVLALVEAASTAFDGVAAVQCGFRDGHWLAVQPTNEHRVQVYGTADHVFPRLIIDAPYGGKGSFQASVGYYRDMCRNLARLQMVGGTTVKIRHTHGLRAQMDELIATFNGLRDGWSNMTTVIHRMEAKPVNMVEFLRSVYGEPDRDSGRSVTIHRNRTEAIFRRLTQERMRSGRPDMGTDWMVSAWEAFNAVQGYTQHDATRRGNPTSLDRIIFAAGDAAVARAEALAIAV
jgi:hypothetical protein